MPHAQPLFDNLNLRSPFFVQDADVDPRLARHAHGADRDPPFRQRLSSLLPDPSPTKAATRTDRSQS